MESADLFQACLKMLNDKYNITDYSKDDFMLVYNDIYKDTLTPNNNLNKKVLVEIKNKIEEKKETKEPDEPKIDMDLKLKEFENLRSSIIKLGAANNYDYNKTEVIDKDSIIKQQPIQITNYNQSSESKKFKTFIINTSKNNFKVSPNIDIKTHIIYPCCISVPIDIKNKTPYLILSIYDGIKNSNYTYYPKFIPNATWDIWKPIINDYIDIGLNNNNWTINIVDNLNNPIDLYEYQAIVLDILELPEYFSLNINKIYYFSINDKIKIIKNNGEISDNRIIDIKDNRLIIYKLKLNMNDFIDSRILNYKNQLSITFKYHIKQP